MPLLDLGIGVSRQSIDIEISALVDSGADATMIPLHYIQQLGAKIQEKRWMSGVAGGRHSVGLYVLYLQVGTFGAYVPVIGDPINSEVIVGRDVLNRLVITLDGLAETVEIAM